MAKLAVIFFAAVAFQTVFAGVARDYDLDRDLEDYTYGGQYEGLVGQIRGITNDLARSLEGTYLNTKQMRWILRDYAQNVEYIITKLQKYQGTIGDVEANNVIQKIIYRLRQVLVPVMQITDVEIVENVDVLRTQFIRELESAAEELQQWVQYGQIGFQQTFIQDVLYDYLRVIRHILMQIQGEYQGQTLYKYEIGQRDLLGNDLRMGNLYKYERNGKGIAMQIQVIINELAESFQNLRLDNVALRQVLINQLREYIQVLETIVEQLQELNYDTQIDIKYVIGNLREIVLSLRQLCRDARLTMPIPELRTQLIMYIQNFGYELQKLVLDEQYEIQQIEGNIRTSSKDVLVKYLIATRNLHIQLQNIAQLPQLSQITTRVGLQIQTLAHGLTTALESVSVNNKQVRDVLIVLSRELAQQIEIIVERLQAETGYGVEVTRVVENLRQIIVSLRRIAGLENLTYVSQLKMQLIVYIQETASEIQRLLWITQHQLQGQNIDSVLYEILNDFIVTLQNQQIQLQNVYQGRQYGQNLQKLAIQIQTITNNLAIFLQNIPINGQRVDLQVRKLILTIENIIDRIEIEVTYSNEGTNVQQVVRNLRQIVASLEHVSEWETSNHGLILQLHLVFQNVAVELKKLAWIAQSDVKQVQENLTTVVRSVLVQYLVVLQRVQIELQNITQTVQIGQTPRELALQIQIVAKRVSEMLRVIPVDRQNQYSLIWQVRRFYQIIENIVDRLEIQIARGNRNVDLLQQILSNLTEIKLSLQQYIHTPYVAGIQQWKIQLPIYIQDAAVEIKKLMWVGQFELKGNTDVIIRGVLSDFLAGLQTLQMQLQTNFQIVLGGQNPRSLTNQIQSVSRRLFAYLHWAQLQPNTLELRQALIIQIGDVTHTIENLVQMLRNEIKNNVEHVVPLQQILARLTKISLSLQEIQGIESRVTVNELCSQLAMHVQDVVAEVERLCWIAQSKLEQTQINFDGALNGALNNVLATLCNMLIQLQTTQEVGESGQNIKELANQIQMVTNKLTTSVQDVVAGTKQVKQAIAIHVLKYTRRVQNIVDRLETEVTYVNGMKIDHFRQIAYNLRQIVVGLRQIAESLVTKTNIELKNQLLNYIQNVNAEIQQLLLIESNVEKYQCEVDTVVRSIVIEYLAALQNLHIRVQYIHHASQKGLTLHELAVYIQNIVSDLSSYFQRIEPTNQLVKQIITTEARQLIQVCANIVNKLQSEAMVVVGNNGLLHKVAIQLKEIQLSLQRIVEVEAIGDIRQQRIQFIVYVQRAAAIVEELLWAVHPELQLTQISTGADSLVKDILNEFLTCVQNVDIQIQIVLQHGQVGHYSLGLGLRGLQGLLGLQGLEQYADRYGVSKIGQSGLELYERQYSGELQGRQMIQSPEQCISELKMLVRELSASLQETTFNDQQVSQVLLVQIRRFAQVIRQIIGELETQVIYGNVEVTVQETIDRLREVEMTLQRLSIYNTLSNVRELKGEFDNYVQIVIAQIQRLVLIAQEEAQGNWYLLVKNVLSTLFREVQDICYQLRDVAQYGQAYRYGYNYDQIYGFGKYGQGLFGLRGWYKYENQHGTNYGLGDIQDDTDIRCCSSW